MKIFIYPWLDGYMWWKIIFYNILIINHNNDNNNNNNNNMKANKMKMEFRWDLEHPEKCITEYIPTRPTKSKCILYLSMYTFCRTWCRQILNRRWTQHFTTELARVTSSCVNKIVSRTHNWKPLAVVLQLLVFVHMRAGRGITIKFRKSFRARLDWQSEA
jgi:hypothetical protein